MSFQPCAAANCHCENFLVPKSGNPKKCANINCGHHPLSAYHSSTISTEWIDQVEGNSKEENQIISLTDEEDSDIQVLEFQKMSTLLKQSRIPYSSMVVSTNTHPIIGPEWVISFNTNVNHAQQKATSKGLHETQSLPKSGYAPRTVSSIIASFSHLLPLSLLQVKTTIWTWQDGNHMVKENHFQWWNFPLDNHYIDYNDWFSELVQDHTGWQEWKEGKFIQFDSGPTSPILIGETELKGNQTTIPVPEGSGSSRDLLQNIPEFLDNWPIDGIPLELTKKKDTITTSQNIGSLSIVVPTTLIEESRKGRVPGWSPKKIKQENIREMVKKK